MNMELATTSYPRSSSPISRTNTHLINEMGSMQDEIKRLQTKLTEKLGCDTSEIKLEVFDKASKEIGLLIKKEVKDQCEGKELSPESKKVENPAHRMNF